MQIRSLGSPGGLLFFFSLSHCSHSSMYVCVWLSMRCLLLLQLSIEAHGVVNSSVIVEIVE